MYYNVLNGNGFFRDADAGKDIFNVNEIGCLTHSNKRCLFFKNSPRAVFFSPQHVKSQCTLFLSVSLPQVNTCSPQLCTRALTCMGHGVKMDKKGQDAVTPWCQCFLSSEETLAEDFTEIILQVKNAKCGGRFLPHSSETTVGM